MRGKVVVTGANGHVGNNIVRTLLSKGYTVRATVRDIQNPNKTKELRALGVEIVEADLLDKESLVNAFSGCEGLFQVAAGYKMHTRDLELDVRRPALEGTSNALEAAHQVGIKKIVYTSSTVTIGSSRVGMKKDEKDWNNDAKEFYAKCKTEAEQLLWKKAKKLNLDVVAILPGVVIGPNFFQHTPSTFFFEKLLKGKVPMMLPISFSYVDVRDLAVAHIEAYENKDANGRYITCNDLIEMKDVIGIFKKVDSTLKLPNKFAPKFIIPMLPFLDWIETKVMGGMRTMTKGVVQEYLDGSVQDYDKSKIKKELHWKPRPIEETLVDTLKWIKNNNVKVL